MTKQDLERGDHRSTEPIDFLPLFLSSPCFYRMRNRGCEETRDECLSAPLRSKVSLELVFEAKNQRRNSSSSSPFVFFRKEKTQPLLPFSLLPLSLSTHSKTNIQNLLAIGLVAILITYHYLVAEPLPV